MAKWVIMLSIYLILGLSAPAYGQAPTASPDHITQAVAGVKTNAEWEIYIEMFDGVEMVLVPAGCFMMGSDDGETDEAPAHEQCFDAPFWIDRYEVTNEQYGSVGCPARSSAPEQPVNCVSWFDAKAHCESRAARLPTEREWEYAARGPDHLIFPWGDDWEPDAANWINTSGEATYAVGSFPDGVSWVGSYDMSGNVWEWVSTIYDAFPYPYDADDGREDDNDQSSTRVIRGGSFYDIEAALRTMDRSRNSPDFDFVFFGFRCVRDFAEG